MMASEESDQGVRSDSYGIGEFPMPKPLMRQLSCQEADELCQRLERGEQLSRRNYLSLVKHANECSQHRALPDE